MDPFTIAALVAGAGGVLSSIFGGISESQQAQAANQVNEQNFELQKEAYEDSKLGAIDANGNRTHFVPGVGWVSTYGPAEQDAYNFYASQEIPLQEQQYLRAAQESNANAGTADALLREFQGIQRADPTDYANMLYAAASRGINDNTKNALEVALRQALRSGSSATGNIMESVQKANNKSLADAALDSKLQALDYVNSKYANDRSNTANLYNVFLSNARQNLAAPVVAGNTNASQVMSNQAATPQKASPVADNGIANAIGGAASSIGGAFNAYGANQQNQQFNNALLGYLSNGGAFNVGSGGIFNNVANRAASTGSTF